MTREKDRLSVGEDGGDALFSQAAQYVQGSAMCG